MIVIDHLKKDFGDLQVLKDVNATIEKGERVVIIGASGSGKSTLLRCLNLLEEPTGGHILFEGTDLMSPRPISTPPAAKSAWFFSISICFPI